MYSTAGLWPESASPTVEELISQLRSSFFSAEFRNVEQTLKQREEEMNRKYVQLNKLSEEEKSSLRSENLKLIGDLNKKQKQVDELRKENSEFKDQIEALNSEKCVSDSKKLGLEDELKKKQKLIDELRKENSEFKDRIKALNSEKCSSDSKKLGLEDELKKKQSEIDAMKKQNAELEKKVRVYEKRSLDFEVRVLSLEKTAKELMDSYNDLENKKHNKSAPESASGPPLLSERKESNKREENKFPETIYIDDDDDDDDDDHEIISTLKRKRVSEEITRECNSDDDDDLKVISTLKRPRVSKGIKGEHDCDYELHNQPIASPPLSTPQSAKIQPFVENIEPKKFISSLDSSDSSSSSGRVDIAEAFMSSCANMVKDEERWKDEADMIEDLKKDDELCMNGICALQRRKIIVHGSDTSSIATLARTLVNGDQEGKLTKTASELKPSDLSDCQMYARKYSIQLFNIYKEKSDPFFPPRNEVKKFWS